MRLRFGLVVGFCAGYYLGAQAGRQRYEQLNRMIRRVRGSEAYEQATEKAKTVVDVGSERAKEGAAAAKDKMQDKMHRSDGTSTRQSEFSPT